MSDSDYSEDIQDPTESQLADEYYESATRLQELDETPENEEELQRINERLDELEDSLTRNIEQKLQDMTEHREDIQNKISQEDIDEEINMQARIFAQIYEPLLVSAQAFRVLHPIYEDEEPISSPFEGYLTSLRGGTEDYRALLRDLYLDIDQPERKVDDGSKESHYAKSTVSKKTSRKEQLEKNIEWNNRRRGKQEEDRKRRSEIKGNIRKALLQADEILFKIIDTEIMNILEDIRRGKQISEKRTVYDRKPQFDGGEEEDDLDRSNYHAWMKKQRGKKLKRPQRDLDSETSDPMLKAVADIKQCQEEHGDIINEYSQLIQETRELLAAEFDVEGVEELDAKEGLAVIDYKETFEKALTDSFYNTLENVFRRFIEEKADLRDLYDQEQRKLEESFDKECSEKIEEIQKPELLLLEKQKWIEVKKLDNVLKPVSDQFDAEIRSLIIKKNYPEAKKKKAQKEKQLEALRSEKEEEIERKYERKTRLLQVKQEQVLRKIEEEYNLGCERERSRYDANIANAEHVFCQSLHYFVTLYTKISRSLMSGIAKREESAPPPEPKPKAKRPGERASQRDAVSRRSVDARSQMSSSPTKGTKQKLDEKYFIKIMEEGLIVNKLKEMYDMHMRQRQ